MSAETFSSETAVQYLQQVAGRPASVDSLSLLAGTVGLTVREQLGGNSDGGASGLALAYLQAAARHLPGISPAGTVEGEINGASRVGEILDTIGWCVTKCVPRSVISDTGILPILHSMSTNDDDILTRAHVEFLQACIFAEQYNYAERHIISSWPRPNGNSVHSVKSVQQVLRYYYLRGVVHMGCRNWALAVRNFWACLSIPGPDQNVVSAVAIAAWKKMVLVQCCQADLLETCVPLEHPSQSSVKSVLFGSGTQKMQPQKGPLATPKEMSTGMTRYLSTAAPPPGSRSVGIAATNLSSPLASPRSGVLGGVAPAAPEDHPDAMHMVEVEGETAAVNELDERPNDPTKYPNKGVRVYQELVKAFIEVDRVAFSAILQEHAKLFHDDGNMGMAQQAEAVLLHRLVYQISSMYAVISQEQLIVELGLSSVEQLQTLLLQVATKKKWPVEVQDGVVIFPQLPPSTENEDDVAMTAAANELVVLSRKVQLLDVSVASSSKYSTVVRREVAAALKSEKGPRGVEDI